MRTQLLNNAYKEFPLSKTLDKYAIANYQRCFRGGDRGKLFFITVYEYGPIEGFTPPPANRFNAKAQFKNEDGRYFDVTLHRWDTVVELNTFFSKMFRLLNCIPYEN
jgi:hypothetical protein